MKRVPTADVNSLEVVPEASILSFSEASAKVEKLENGEEVFVALDAVPLRSFELLIGNGVTAECVMDSGSSIVAMRRDIWEKTGLSLRSDLVMNMRSAHNTMQQTSGVVVNYPFKIGTSTFYVQVQVTDQLPCDIILGLPFLLLASGQFVCQPEGGVELVLRDPNTGAQHTIPTKEVEPEVRRKRNF